MLRPVEDHEVGRAAGLDDAAIQPPQPRRVAGGEAEGGLGRNVAERGEHGDETEDAERLHARAGRGVGAEDDLMELVELSRGAQREQRRTQVAVVHELDAARALLDEFDDLIVGKRGMAAVDVADDVGIGLEHHVLVDQAGPGDRRTAGVDRALDAVLARPGHHRLRLVRRLHRTEAHLAHEPHPAGGELAEVLLRHLPLRYGGAGVQLDPEGAEVRVHALRGDRPGLEADDVLGASREVHLAGGHHLRHPAVKIALDPAELILPWRPVSGHRMDMAVDEAGTDDGAVAVHDRPRPFDIEFALAADRRDPAFFADDAIRLDDGRFERAAQDESDVPEHELAGCRGVHRRLPHPILRRSSISTLRSSRSSPSRVRSVIRRAAGTARARSATPAVVSRTRRRRESWGSRSRTT